ncbi:MAG: hypothetical protein C6Y20_10145 [Tagaea sp. CACIAM 22H2]|nr:hypothetical protein [Tagaea sp. CACIAM 22H2]
MTLEGAIYRAKALVLQFGGWFARQLDREFRKHRSSKRRAIGVLARFWRARRHQSRLPGRTLIDLSWDNPNWWLRLTLVRAALGHADDGETGLLDVSNRDSIRWIARALGITDFLDVGGLRKPEAEWLDAADKLIAEQGSSPDEIMAWRLPEDVDARALYDFVLRQQLTLSPQSGRPDFKPLVAEFLAGIAAARIVLDLGDWRRLVMSHAQGAFRAPLLHMARRRGIDCIVLYGHYGATHFYRLREHWQLFEIQVADRGPDFERILAIRGEELSRTAERYLSHRFNGLIDEESCRAAFVDRSTRVDVAEIRRRFGWDESKPIIAVYAPTWYEWPNYSDITRYRDYWDWFTETMDVARESKHVYWLVKLHPGADTLLNEDDRNAIAAAIPRTSHVAIVPDGWQGHGVMVACDGLVTLNGTGGLEAACLGKPVLVADKGWYGDCGFTVFPGSRNAYVEALAGSWWRQHKSEWRERALAMAAQFWTIPSWQAPTVLRSDSLRDELYADILYFAERHGGALDKEVDCLRAWIADGSSNYNSFKIRSVADNLVPLIRTEAVAK